MKIVILTFNASGGLNHYISQLANSLAKSEEVTVIGPLGFDRAVYSDRVKTIGMHLGNVIPDIFTDIIIFTRMLDFVRCVREEQPDIIHCNNFNLWSGFLLPLFEDVPIVLTVHDVSPHPGTRGFDKRWGLKQHIALADRVIVHGNNAKERLGLGDKCVSLPHGDYSFFLDFATPVAEEEAILFFGRIEEYKGLEFLLEAMVEVGKRYPDVKLIIAGSGDLSKYDDLLRRQTNLEVHNRYIADQEVPSFFQRAKLVVLPYLEVTQSGVIPIAYSFRKPVVATDVGSIPEVVDDGATGVIVPPADARGLASAITALLDDEERRKRMGENAYRMMRSELSWTEIARRTTDIYRDLSVRSGDNR
ncbi:MAG: glycosyltransferase family 4 protein [Methanomassiliicoccus sp.]|nr:glycosyltransferase family 4 protein [Methanomassiliicoccus sp.]